MYRSRLNIVILGLSLTSSQSNGQAMNYRGLIRELAARGHHVLFLEREQSWCCNDSDFTVPPHGHKDVYSSLVDLKDRFRYEVGQADLVIVCSSLLESVAISEWVTSVAGGATAFHDFETPMTLSKLRAGGHESLEYSVLSRFDLYLSSTGGPTLEYLKQKLGVALAWPLYRSVDPEVYYPETTEVNWDLGYLGAEGDDCLSRFELLMLEPGMRCRELRMIAAGTDHPQMLGWPSNVGVMTKLNPPEDRSFYNAQRFTLNLTSPERLAAGYSPSLGLFESAACSTPIISDWWPGLETFFEPGREILIARTPDDVLCYLHELSEEERTMIGERAWVRVLTRHTTTHRAVELERYAFALLHRESFVSA